MDSYEDLKVWQRAMEICTAIYKLTESFPAEEKFGLISQMRRCAVSVPSNIAEGRHRSTKKDFRGFLYIAFGSSAELQTQLEIAQRLGYLTPSCADDMKSSLNELMKMLIASMD